jgi:hypothetical protein
VNNPRLDTITYNDVKGFPCFGKIVSGLTVIDSIYSGYASRSVDQLDTLYRDRKKYLSAFPKLDIIRKFLSFLKSPFSQRVDRSHSQARVLFLLKNIKQTINEICGLSVTGTIFTIIFDNSGGTKVNLR